MSANLTNSNITAIAFKRLSGKAMTSGKFSLPEESLGSFVQTTNQTLFADTFPLEPTSQSADLYKIQSASLGAAGSVMYVEFDLEVLPNTEYNNNTQVDTNSSLAEQGVTNRDLGDTTLDVTTFHAYQIKLKSTFEDDVAAVQTFADHASTTTAIGSAPFANSFAATGSVQFQIVPEYVTTVNVNNPYVPSLIDKQGTVLEGTDGIDYYIDTAAGIVFVQDPVDVYTANAAQVPDKLRAFLYVGKYQSEISAGDTVSIHLSGSEGGGFSLSNESTASFETGSGGGLTITANSSNTLTFELNDVVSGSAGIWYLSGSTGGGGSVAAQETASFKNGGAGLTVKYNTDSSGKVIEIGTATDDVTFNQITGSNLLITETASIAYFHTVFNTASIIYTSGSTKFGNSSDDTHELTGSLYLTTTGSVDGASGEFNWKTPQGSTSQIPLVWDSSTGNIRTGSAYALSADGMTQFQISGSSGGFDVTEGNTVKFVTGSTSGEGLTVTAGAPDTVTFNLVNVVSGSGQILDGTGILSSSTQNFTQYSSSVVTLIDELEASASAGIFFSASNGGTSIALTGTASFEGGDGITITNTNGTLTIESDYGELNSAIHIGTGSNVASADGASIGFGGTASFDASGTGLTVDNDGAGVVTYTVDPNTLIEAVDTATVINITASYAQTASFITGSNVYGPYGSNSVISSSHAEVADVANGLKVFEETNGGSLTIAFTSVAWQDALTDGQANDATIYVDHGLSYSPNVNTLQIAAGTATANPTASTINERSLQAIGGATDGASAEYNLLTSNTNLTTINMGTAAGTVYLKGSASIAGDLIVQGTTTTLNTANLLVEDRYILLASGSNTNTVGGGIVVERSAQNVGTALHWDETNDVWAVDLAGATAATATAKAIDFNLVGVVQNSGNPSGAPNHGSGDYKLGQMYINTTDSDNDGNTIWIYAT